MKSRKGSVTSVDDILMALLLMVAFFVFITVFIYLCRCSLIKEDANQIVRGYLMEMETVGYLTQESKDSMLQDLLELQITDIDFSGTTTVDGGYGNKIYLQVSFKIPTKTLNMSGSNIMSFFFEDQKIDITIRKMSTAKR